MASKGLTAAAIISFCEGLEDRSAAFYEALAERWPEEKETFQAFAKEDRRNKKQVVRTYQETISDVLEAHYSFAGLDLGEYEIASAPRTDVNFLQDLEQAIALEETACAFYLEVAERSKSLLATIPRAFQRVAQKRRKRQSRLEALLRAAEPGS